MDPHAESHGLSLGLTLLKVTVVSLSIRDDASPGTPLRSPRAFLLSSSGGQSIFLLSPLLMPRRAQGLPILFPGFIPSSLLFLFFLLESIWGKKKHL